METNADHLGVRIALCRRWIFGFVETCSYGAGQRPINQFFAWVMLMGVVATILGLLWGVVEFVLFAVRRYKDREL